MRLVLVLGSGNVDRLYREVEGKEDLSSPSLAKENMFNEWVSCFDAEVVIERWTDPAPRMVPTVD